MKLKNRLSCLLLLAFSIWIIVTAIGLYSLWQYGELRVLPAKKIQSVYGIDVSHHQHHIDWQQLKHGKARFVYIKASEGATFQDQNFIENWHGAQQANLIPGAYHYFTFCRSGADQAANLLTILSRVHGKQLPLAVDLEFGGNCIPHPTQAQFETELHNFLNRVQAQTGCTPILYVTQDFYQAYLKDAKLQNPLWIRGIGKKPTLKNRVWTFWQFADRGKLDGIDTPVDLNVFHATNAALEKMTCHPTVK